MGDCYRYGYGVQQDANQAAYSYTKATQAGVGNRALVGAHSYLADMYEKGEGLSKSQERAAFHLMFAADRYNPDAQLKVALMFEEENGSEMNLNRAIMYFKLSARGGNATAHLKVEKYIEIGYGVERPRKLSTETIQEVADIGHYGAQTLVRTITRH